VKSAIPPIFHWQKIIVICCVLALVLPVSAIAQQKRPIAMSDFDSWRSIQAPQLSRNGKYVAYALVPQEGDGDIVLRDLTTGKEWRHTRGFQPPAIPQPGAETFVPPSPRLNFTADARFLIFQIHPLKAETDKAKREKRKPEDMPKAGLGIMDVTTGEVSRINDVKSFQVPEDGNGFIAYLLEAKKEEKKAEAPSPDKKPESPTTGANKKKKEYGADLILRNLHDKSERTFAEVLEYQLSKDAKNLVYAVSAKKEEGNGVYALATDKAIAPMPMLSGKGKYAKLTWDDKQTQLAFISDRDDAAAPQPAYKLYSWSRNAATATELISSTAFKAGWGINEKAALAFSLDGAKLFFGTAPLPEPEREDDTPADDRVVADLWHYKEDYIQPMQKVRAEQERSRSYRAVVHLNSKRFVQLGDETMRDVTPSNDGRYALGLDDRAYRTMIGYEDASSSSDVYLLNTEDGSRKPLLKKHRFGVTFSPSGKYAAFFDGKDWQSVSIPNGKLTNLTANLSAKFFNEEHDSPSVPPAYGSVGWTADEKYILLNDRYDIWQIAPNGSDAKNLTDGIGRKEKIEFRYVKLDAQEKAIDQNKLLLLRAENEQSRDSGFYRERINGGMPEKVVMAAKNFTAPQKAKDADVMLLTASTFTEFPDLLISNSNLNEMKKITDANPQKSQMLWGSAELVSFKNADGVPLSGILYKPENFDPNKKYPLVVYIYERLSEGLHRFVPPQPGQNVNPLFYASNGYLVLMPDIVYTIGYPGQSALKCVLPAIQSVVDKGFVNENAIGIQGHSWGGYQIAYMVTQTSRFKAAAAGAPVANMTSAYSGIRWGTGLPRQFQYEHSQSRIGGTLWEKPMLYLENSPVFNANRVQTPMLLLHNDNDDAVPWYQGIEYFLALRRLGKEAYLFNYNGEPHGIRKRQNQKDYFRRTWEFFNYHLRGAAKPEWMERGIPYTQREKEKEQYRPAPPERAKAQN